MKKNIRILVGVILHPFKLVLFAIRGGVAQYENLTRRANNRTRTKQIDRCIYMSSLTNTPLYYESK